MEYDVLGSLLHGAIRGAASLCIRDIARRDPLAAQRDILRSLLRTGAASRFGADYLLGELRHSDFESLYRAYRDRLPIRTYEQFWSDYFRAHYREDEGGRSLSLVDVTWPGRISFFCETSGTTAPTKLIPFSAEMFRANKQAARDMAAAYLARRPRSGLFPGKILYMSGNTALADLGNGVRSGDMSAITLLHPPPYLKPFVLPEPAVAALPWEEKLEAMARLLLDDPQIRAISGVPPWILLLLRRVAEQGGRPLPDLLPGLELIIHGGTSMKPYRKEYDRIWGGREPEFLELLPSSEAFMAFQVPGEGNMRFTPYYGVFFEFVPAEYLDDAGVPPADAPAVPLEEVRAGETYAVILTTCSGLWRYHIGDTLRFVSLDPLQVEFAGRTRFLDRFEEKVTQGEVEQAVARLNREEGVAVREFMVGPEIGARRHLWVVGVNPTGKGADALAAALDGYLREGNADYATFRSQGRISPPRLVTAEPDAIYCWSRDVRGKLGGQSKIPHVDPTVDGAMILDLEAFVRRSGGRS